MISSRLPRVGTPMAHRPTLLLTAPRLGSVSLFGCLSDKETLPTSVGGCDRCPRPSESEAAKPAHAAEPATRLLGLALVRCGGVGCAYDVPKSRRRSWAERLAAAPDATGRATSMAGTPVFVTAISGFFAWLSKLLGRFLAGASKRR